jgi:hypothetical protein
MIQFPVNRFLKKNQKISPRSNREEIRMIDYRILFEKIEDFREGEFCGEGWPNCDPRTPFSQAAHHPAGAGLSWQAF